MIDAELHRQHHKQEYANEWMAQNREAVLKDFKGDDNLMLLDEEKENYRQHKKDVQLAKNNPQSYCADRCITTGHCDVYEDLYVQPTNKQ